MHPWRPRGRARKNPPCETAAVRRGRPVWPRHTGASWGSWTWCHASDCRLTASSSQAWSPVAVCAIHCFPRWQAVESSEIGGGRQIRQPLASSLVLHPSSFRRDLRQIAGNCLEAGAKVTKNGQCAACTALRKRSPAQSRTRPIQGGFHCIVGKPAKEGGYRAGPVCGGCRSGLLFQRRR